MNEKNREKGIFYTVIIKYVNVLLEYHLALGNVHIDAQKCTYRHTHRHSLTHSHLHFKH